MLVLLRGSTEDVSCEFHIFQIIQTMTAAMTMRTGVVGGVHVQGACGGALRVFFLLWGIWRGGGGSFASFFNSSWVMLLISLAM